MARFPAWCIDRPGPPSALRLADLPDPALEPGEVRVDVHAVGLNPIDHKMIASGAPTWAYPHVPGVDAAGVVAEVGEGVTALAVGDRVAYHGDLTRPGTFARRAVTTALTTARLPDGVAFEDAAALPCAAMTAYQALHRRLRVRPGDPVLVVGGAGGVGAFAVQVAALAGAEVIAVASPADEARVRAFGARHVLDRFDPDWPEAVRRLTGGHGVPAAVDTASPASATLALSAVAFGGGLAVVAGLPDLDAYRQNTSVVSLHRIALGRAHVAGNEADRRDLAVMLDALLAELAAGRLSPNVARLLPFEELPQGLAALQEGGVKGKIVVRADE